MAFVRPVTAQDLPQILDILNYEIANGFAHFGTEPQALEEIRNEFEQAGNLPWMAAIEGDNLIGFAKASRWKPRGGYGRTCEIGVYVRPDYQGRGIAKLIYTEFLKDLKARQFHTILAGVALPNPASVKLHESFGFKFIGTFPEVGWKLEAWRDVGYWALVFPSPSPS